MGGGAQPHSIAFGGVFPNITEAILVDEISTKVRIYPPKWSLNTKVDEFPMKMMGSPNNGNIRAFSPNVASRQYALLEKRPP